MEIKNCKILVIDDDQGVAYTARVILKQHYSEIKSESNPVTAFEQLKSDKPDIVILDMNFRSGATSGEEGIDWLKRILEESPETQIIMHTAYGAIDLAVTSMQEGAADFLTKPWDQEKLLAKVDKVYQLIESRRKVENLENTQATLLRDMDSDFGEMVGQNNGMMEIRSIIDKVSVTDANVLILGENGTGKELVARQLHRQSNRSTKPFIKVDLGAIPETLFESELFGHTRGAFTDAKESRAGRFEVANSGTLFLDEIGNLSINLQAKMLTAIQSKQISRVGSADLITVDIRLICATNKDIYEEVDDGNFRQDLLYRINTVEINVPSLRNRLSDIPLLIRYYLNIYKRKYLKPDLKIDKEILNDLKDYHWPGNIRELRHAVERAVIMSTSDALCHKDFLLTSNSERKRNISKAVPTNISDMEKQTIMRAVEKHDGNLSQAAAELGMGRTTLYRKIKKHDLNI